MSKYKRRKMRPQPAKWFWADTDGCWDCPNRHGCGGCKKLKQHVAHINNKHRKLTKKSR